MSDSFSPLPPIFLDEQYRTQRGYTSPRSGGKSPNLLKRDTRAHGKKLYNQLAHLLNEYRQLPFDGTEIKGVYIEVSGAEKEELNIDRLDIQSKKIRLVNFKNDDLQTAVFFLPFEKSNYLLNKLSSYMNETTKKGNPKHNALFAPIEKIIHAEVASFWSGDIDKIPSTEKKWCEVWLINNEDNTEKVKSEFVKVAKDHNIEIKVETDLDFPERVVTLAKLNRQDITNLILYYPYLAEIRPHVIPNISYTNLDYHSQLEWINDLKNRTTINPNSRVSVCILDTGVNNAHPLLKDILSDEDRDSFDPHWGVHDHHKHGTEMGGIVAYGDLNECLSTMHRIELNHTLSSYKILPPQGGTDIVLWGWIMEQAVANREIKKPDTIHIYSMSVTSKMSESKESAGMPSSWSSSIDKILFNKDTKKIFCISVGNTEYLENTFKYKDGNIITPIENPAQSWNALSIGAYTQKDSITDHTGEYSNYNTRMAKKGEISPFTTTSCTWNNQWCIKPDVVFEGGNLLLNTSTNDTTEHEDLSLLTTNFDITQTLITWTYATSAANAMAANFIAKLYAAFPDATPETIRGLVVHSARWTEEMLRQFGQNGNFGKSDYKALLRICGYGVPDFDRAVNCYTNSLTLIAQDSIQPFEKEKQDIKTREMNLYELPWPKEALEELGSQEIEMRVTLSYFIEPAPTNISLSGFDRYNYPSHGLRFEVIHPAEDPEHFKARCNKKERDENFVSDYSSSDYWKIGEKNRNKGCVISDIWKGTAAELASCNHIAVFPTSGWWKTRKYLKAYDKIARYTLIVSIYSSSTEVDIYTPVSIKVKVPIKIEI